MSPDYVHLVVEPALVLLFNVVLGLALRPLPVNKVQTLGLDLAVNESTGKSSHQFLGHLVVGGWAYIEYDESRVSMLKTLFKTAP